MFFIATGGGWQPSLNPLGTWSATAIFISAIAWFSADRRFLKSERAHGWLAILLPICLLAFVFHSKVHIDVMRIGLVYDWRNWRFHAPDAQDFFADYIFIAVSLVLAGKAALLPVRDLRLVGIGIFAIAALFLGLEIGLLFQSRYAG
jgi:hypothetical protein